MVDLVNTLIFPDWPAPASVHAASTTRRGGVSRPPHNSLNLGYHSQDDTDKVTENRRRLAHALDLPKEPVWLKQVHGRGVIEADKVSALPEADASFSRQTGVVCVVMTADCLPVLLCNRAGTCVAAVHAGWRGLARGVIGATVERMGCAPGDLMAWLGPAIGADVFEVGEEVYGAFLELDEGNAVCFRASPRGRWLADIYELARRQLRALGIIALFGGGWCTLTQGDKFFSYRRDGSSGRMASLIWSA